MNIELTAIQFLSLAALGVAAGVAFGIALGIKLYENFNTEAQRHRDTEKSSKDSVPLSLRASVLNSSIGRCLEVR